VSTNVFDPLHCSEFWPCAPAGALLGIAITVLVWVTLRVVKQLAWPELVAWEKREKKHRRTPPKVCLDCEVGEPHACEILFDRERETR
jgi:hypothetical protein